MPDVTQILSEIEHGDPAAAERLLQLVYDELRKLAAAKLANEKPGQTLQATALVHEAYIRLVDAENVPRWDSRRHFFAAAAEAMRRILIERARRHATIKHGGKLQRVEFDDQLAVEDERAVELIALDEALSELESHDAQAAQLVKLRHFAGLSHQQAADALQISRRAADRLWVLAKAWLYQRISAEFPK
jgi:RNA polymerase sigma factor (TIGR02999 family)